MSNLTLCPCGSNLTYSECCEPIIKGTSRAKTAEALMRSRYSAYVKKEFEHLRLSLLPKTRATYDEKSTIQWASKAVWENLKIIKTIDGSENDNEGFVEFLASYSENGVKKTHHEFSFFQKENGQWYYVESRLPQVKQVIREATKIGRNDPCTCGSGKKYKKCCGAKPY
jgi:SEC-C motif-containing protein